MSDFDRWCVAQLNIGLPLEPIGSERLAGFVAQLEPINALADAAPGFVWRLQTEDGDATAIHAFDDERLIMNMSVWESLESLGDFVFRSPHTAVMRQRREWFVPMREAFACLWWTREIPSLAEAERRLDHIRAHGPTEFAFTFREPHPAPAPAGPSAPSADPIRADDDWFCPA